MGWQMGNNRKERIRFEIKEVTQEGTFEGLLSPYGNVDGGGDAIMPGAYTKTLRERGNEVPMLWQHSTKDPIGKLILEDRPEGLWCKGQFILEDELAARAYRFVRARIVKGLSIGFEAVKAALDSNGVRRISEIKLYEGSVVTFPMNEAALIVSVKAAGGTETKGDFNEELNAIQLQDAGYQMISALSAALYSITWAEMTREDKLAARAAAITQFADADAAYFPAYLDVLSEMYGDAMETWSAKRFEIKAGRRFSAATMKTLGAIADHHQSAADHTKSANELLTALLDEGAESPDDTSKDAITPETKAAVATKPEPEDFHSAAKTLDSIGALFRVA
jgi:HK97 family phage prohead protease